MKIIPLGGAEEVGATCTLIEIGGHRILIDAGIRMSGEDKLPDLSRISDFGGIEAILVTHAHTDHTGALPVVHRAFPNIPIYTTPGTQAITSVLFNDALKIMNNRSEQEGDIPLYDAKLVESLFTRFQPVQLNQTVKLFGGDVSATFFPAGHILGAACIGLQSEANSLAGKESIFFTGDYSVTPQLTVAGMLPPMTVDRKFRPQAIFTESTYGNRLHANRETEIRRLAESVAQVIEAGGRVLIPAFAVGRAQEILLILAKAMRDGVVNPFPVWVDGMVRAVCGVYNQFPFDLSKDLQYLMRRQGNPFFGPKAGVNGAIFTAISTPEERLAIAESGKPGCIVASSGMLTGGPSAFFARYLAQEPNSAIFITGYQDEESPGRALLNLAEATNPADRILKLDGGETVQVQCLVGKYSLSAHVDAGQVAGLVDKLEPQETILVHGAGGAREALADLLVSQRDRRVTLPRASDEVDVAGRRSNSNAARKRAAATANQDLQKPEATPTTSNSASQEPDYSQIQLPQDLEQLALLREKLAGTFGDSAGRVTRNFTIPDLAKAWAALWPNLQSPTLQQDSDTPITKEVDIIKNDADNANDSDNQEVVEPDYQSDGIVTSTGYQKLRALINQRGSGFVSDNRHPHLYRIYKRLGEGSGEGIDVASLSSGSKKASREPKKEKASESEWPVNQIVALQVVDKLMPRDLVPDLYRRGTVVASGTIILYFYFPQVAAENYAKEIEQIAEQTGWKVQLNQEAHQAKLASLLDDYIPSGLRKLKAPSIHHQKKAVQLAVAWEGEPEMYPADPDTDPDFLHAKEKYLERTGFELEFVLSGLAVPKLAVSKVLAALRPLPQLPLATNEVARPGGPSLDKIATPPSLTIPASSELSPSDCESMPVSGQGLPLVAQTTTEPPTTNNLSELPLFQPLSSSAALSVTSVKTVAVEVDTVVTDEATSDSDVTETLPLTSRSKVVGGGVGIFAMPNVSKPITLRARLGFNTASEIISSVFQQAGIKLIKKSLRREDGSGAGTEVQASHIELVFLTPELGQSAQVQAILQELTAQTGWQFYIGREPQQQALKELADGLLRSTTARRIDIKISKFSVFKETREVAIKLSSFGGSLISQEEVAEFSSQFREATGGWIARVELPVVVDAASHLAGQPMPIKQTQLVELLDLLGKGDVSQQEFEQVYLQGRKLEELTRNEASRWLGQLKTASG